MPGVGIVTDSTACIPPDLAAHYGIDVIPLYLAFGQRQYRDGVSDTASDFYETLRTATEPPTTAAPAPGAYAEAIARAGYSRDAVLCVTVARQFSAMYDAAIQGAAIARERTPDLDVRVLDSDAAAMAQGFVTLAAAREAQAGATIDAVLAAAQSCLERVQLIVAIDTLMYLARSGRVPRLLIWAASPLRVKPVVEFQRGSYRPIGVSRTMAGAEERLVQALERRAQGAPVHVCVHHTNAPERAEALAERVRAQLQPRELLVREFTQVMGVHTGPGLLGFAWYSDPPSGP